MPVASQVTPFAKFRGGEPLAGRKAAEGRCTKPQLMPNDSKLEIPMIRRGKFMDAKLAIVPKVTAPKDRTAAERQRRYRERRKLQKAGVTVAPAVTALTDVSTGTPLLPRRHGMIPVVMACAALAVAAVSASFSIIGLTAVFAGAFWPVVGMGPQWSARS
jgi:hypothetical protein